MKRFELGRRFIIRQVKVRHNPIWGAAGNRGSHHVEIVVTGTERSSEKCKRRWSFLAFQRLYLDPGGVNFDRSRAVQPKPRKPGQKLRPPGPPVAKGLLENGSHVNSRFLHVGWREPADQLAAAPPSSLGGALGLELGVTA